MKNLILIRGVPGTGKTTLAGLFRPNAHIEADQFMTDAQGNYKFDHARLSECHKRCQDATRAAMELGLPIIVVSNTFVKRWEMAPYQTLAEVYNYRITEINLNNNGIRPNTHDVPAETVQRMLQNFQP